MLDSYLKLKNLVVTEGYSQQVNQQVQDLMMLSKNKKNIMEIGFNAGHSAELFLSNNPDTILTSFDLGIHDYLKIGKEYIDFTFPGRHTLVLGDSTITVPQYNNQFDVLFIDGGHEYNIAKADLENCRKLATSDTIVIMDDTMFIPQWVASWNVGPTRAWKEFVDQGKIIELGKKDYTHGRGMCWGKYKF